MRKEAHIIGGGIGGLAAAGALAQTGWRVVVHERSPELREVGAGIFLKENGIRVLERLGCMPEILAHGTRLAKSELQSADGRTLLLRDIAQERVYTVLRATLQRMLADAAKRQGVDVETASDVSDVSSDGRLSTGGREYKVDLIVGADGLGSITRRRLGLEKSATILPNGSTRILVPHRAGDLTDRSVEQWRGHKRVMVVPAGSAHTYICASSKESDPRGVALPFDIEYWSQCFPDHAALFARVDPMKAIHHPHGLVHVTGWFRGKVAILGDAVHGQPPNLGQGAGLAISNAGSLAEYLAKAGDVELALKDWESHERLLTEQVQNWSENWDHFVHRWPLGAERLRSLAIWTIANTPITRRRWGRLYRGTEPAPEQKHPVNMKVA